ncbi:MAG: DsbC family protein, partial [Deferrisomatales bacterium]
MKLHRCLSAALSALALAAAGPALAFPPQGAGAKPCAVCHKLTPAEAEAALKGLVDKVLEVRPSEVAGLWDVDVEKQGRKIPVYLHFSKKYVIAGNVIRLDTTEDLTREREVDLNRVDFASIPLDDAVVIGNPKAARKVVVFDDPECPYCVKLHPEMKKVVEQRKDVAFFIKMLPLKIHPTARKKAEA